MGKKEKQGQKKGFKEITADELMHTDPSGYHEDTSGHAIATALLSKKSGAITIVNAEGKPVGIVTEYDLLKAVREGKDLKKVRPREIMTEPVIVSEKTTVAEVLDAVVSGHLIHLPVVDHEERLVGLIERHHVLAAYMERS